MTDSKQEEGNHVPENSLIVGLPDASKSEEGIVIDSASSDIAPPPAVGDFPDGGLAAWLVVTGVCESFATTYTLR